MSKKYNYRIVIMSVNPDTNGKRFKEFLGLLEDGWEIVNSCSMKDKIVYVVREKISQKEE